RARPPGDPADLRRARASPGLTPTSLSLERLLSDAQRALVLGIGGGGDVVGALAAARLCQSFGAEFRLGGVAWERFPVDPYPGPRSIDQISGGKRLGPAAVLA